MIDGMEYDFDAMPIGVINDFLLDAIYSEKDIGRYWTAAERILQYPQADPDIINHMYKLLRDHPLNPDSLFALILHPSLDDRYRDEILDYLFKPLDWSITAGRVANRLVDLVFRQGFKHLNRIPFPYWERILNVLFDGEPSPFLHLPA